MEEVGKKKHPEDKTWGKFFEKLMHRAETKHFIDGVRCLDAWRIKMSAEYHEIWREELNEVQCGIFVGEVFLLLNELPIEVEATWAKDVRGEYREKFRQMVLTRLKEVGFCVIIEPSTSRVQTA